MDEASDIEEIADRIAESIVRSQPAVALTGAGHSTPSGIPDFRSPGTGLWDKIDPMEVASITGFMANPAKFYQFMAPLSQVVKNAKPNPAHHALAELGEMGLLKENTLFDLRSLPNMHHSLALEE